MDIPKFLQKLKRLAVGADTAALISHGNAQTGMDHVIARKPRRSRCAIVVGLAICIGGAAIWVPKGTGGNVYRVPINRLTIGTVTQRPFGDYFAMCGAVAPFVNTYLTTNQEAALKPIVWVKLEGQGKR